MSTYKKKVEVHAPIDTVFDLCISFFENLGYTLKAKIQPTRIEFEKSKKSKWVYLLSADEIDYDHTLSISFFNKINFIEIEFLYDCPAGAWKFSKKSVEKIESDIAAFLSLINHHVNTASKNMPETPIVKEIIKEIVKVKCPYCGALVDQGIDRCPNCGAPLR